MENITEYVITKVNYQFIPELFSGLNLTTSLYRPIPDQEPLLIKKDIQILTNIHKASIWELKQGRSPLYNFERYRLEYPPEKFYSPEQWDQGLKLSGDGWTILSPQDIPPLDSSERHLYYSNRQLCQEQQRELEEAKISGNQQEIDNIYERIDAIILELKEGNGESKQHLVVELDILSDRINQLTTYDYQDIATCQYVLALETENFFEHHWIQKVYCNLEIYTGFLRYGNYGQLFSNDNIDLPVSKGDNFQEWQSSVNEVAIDIHYGHYPYLGYLIFSPYRYEYADIEEGLVTTEVAENLIHSPHFVLHHECRFINKKYRFKERELHSVNTKELIVEYPEHTPFPLTVEVKRMRNVRVAFIDNPEERNILQTLHYGQSYSFQSRYLLMEIQDPDFEEAYYPPNFAVKSKPFQRIKQKATVTDTEEELFTYELSGRYPTNFPCLELAYHHEYLGIQDWNINDFQVRENTTMGDIDAPFAIKEHLASLKIYDEYEELIEQELGGSLE